MALNIFIDKKSIKKTLGALNNLQRKQVPFATANALSSTAFGVRSHIVYNVYPRSFNVKSTKFANAAFRVRKAKKRKLTEGASVFDRLDRGFLRKQIHASNHQAFNSTHIAIPITIKHTPNGKVPAAQKPRRLLASTYRGKRWAGGSFVGRPNGRPLGIYQRDNKTGRLHLHTRYLLRKTVKIDKRFHFLEQAARVARKQFPDHLRKSLRFALSRAK